MFVILFLIAVLGANLSVTYMDPVVVWPTGTQAPAGVLFVAVTLVLRDVVQRSHGAKGVLAALVGGIAASYALADPEIVTASVVAFAVSFLVDTLVFTLVYRKVHQLWVGVLVSGLVSLVPDTYVFLYLADLMEFVPGQLLGKTWGTLLAAALIGGWSWYQNTSQEAFDGNA